MLIRILAVLYVCSSVLVASLSVCLSVFIEWGSGSLGLKCVSAVCICLCLCFHGEWGMGNHESGILRWVLFSLLLGSGYEVLNALRGCSYFISYGLWDIVWFTLMTS